MNDNTMNEANELINLFNEVYSTNQSHKAVRAKNIIDNLYNKVDLRYNVKTPVDAINNALDALEALHSVCTQDNKDVLIQAIESASVARYLATRVNNQDKMGEFSGYQAQVDRFISEPYTPIIHTAIKKFLDIPANGPDETPETIG